ncbi:FmdB family zinc ribbon protein [Thermotoga profunda]|uniref:FmdB family zinc ribbon protein n=1 Tax=Thermotoga profunda TaxID=1508420 RepID=UPI000597C562|nr:FmdB family zinc ribbon protein [Thermotoga profunda]
MPFYRYVCDNCGTQKTILHSINENPVVKCDSCGKEMKREISRVGIVFKGSGFYCTDNKKNGSQPSESKSQSEKEKVA